MFSNRYLAIQPTLRALILTLFITLVLVMVTPLSAQEEPDKPEASKGMTQTQMAIIISDLTGEYEGELNNIQFTYNNVFMALISDATNNRMRIIAPVAEVKDLSQEHLLATLASNFHLALDARYAIGNGILYSTYIHPLKELNKDQLESAVRQVSTLSATFGSTYTSGELSYGVRSAPQEEI